MHTTITSPEPGLLPFFIIGSSPIWLRSPRVTAQTNGRFVVRFRSNGTGFAQAVPRPGQGSFLVIEYQRSVWLSGCIQKYFGISRFSERP